MNHETHRNDCDYCFIEYVGRIGATAYRDILGQVKDASGAVVAGAKITARNTDTGQTRTAVSGDDGSYRLDALPVGNYEITAEKTGFKTEVQSGLTLTSQEAVANFTIQVGEMSQTVAVTAEAPRSARRPVPSEAWLTTSESSTCLSTAEIISI